VVLEGRGGWGVGEGRERGIHLLVLVLLLVAAVVLLQLLMLLLVLLSELLRWESAWGWRDG
jgi:hypothetical protein